LFSILLIHCIGLSANTRLYLQANESNFSIATYIFTTKQMVHAFCGVVISYIDKDWALREYVLDLIPLDGDHSGKSVGKLIFRRLK
jgi:hypothetical protein